MEVGWQATPKIRGTSDILWSCASVIILVTWTSFHPHVGHTWKQRAYTTIMAILLPGLTAIVATRDFFIAYRLNVLLSRYDGSSTWWSSGWTLKKSFLVVKGGVRAEPRGGRPSTASDSTQLVEVTTNEIIDAEKFLSLVMTGRIRYKDFPRTKTIEEKSQTDWFSKVATLVQLTWTVVNMFFRMVSGCRISVLEVLSLQWIVLGLVSAIFWWNCPQNTKSAWIIPVQNHCVLSEETSSLPHLDRSMEEVLDKIAACQHYLKRGEGVKGWKGADGKVLNWELAAAIALIVKGGLEIFIHLFILGVSYQWHSGQFAAWGTFSVFSVVSEVLFIYGDWDRRLDWGSTSIYQAYIRPLLNEPLRFSGSIRPISQWFGSVDGVGNDEVTGSQRLKVSLVAALVGLVCHCGKLIVALVAFKSAPVGIYKVPDIALLEAMMHVGR